MVIGALSAVVGIGGAIVLNPMMVKRGIEVQAATATASLMVLDTLPVFKMLLAVHFGGSAV